MNLTASKRKGVQGQTVSIANDRIELRRLPAPKRLRLPTRQNLSAAATKLQAGLEEGGSSDRVSAKLATGELVAEVLLASPEHHDGHKEKTGPQH